MAKRKKRKGGRRYRRKGKKSKGSGKKQSLAVMGAGAWDGYKVLTTDVGGQTLLHRLVACVYDPAQRAVIIQMAKNGSLKNIALNNTRELQGVALVKVGEMVPLIKEPIRAGERAVNSAGRKLGLPRKYKVI